jgi:Holliday junction DNA helicase RuvA
MIAYLQGKITFKSPTYVYLDIGGIAYHVEISLNTFSEIEAKSEVKLFTYLHIKEDGHYLYGFYTEKERDLFKMLISVSGIGPNTAQVILSSMNPDQIVSSILNEQDTNFKNVKGIGAKTAKRIILDLKDKLKKAGFEQGGFDSDILADNQNIRQEVISALKGLGINRAKAEPLLNKILQENPDLDQLEDVLKMVLKQLN